MNLRRHCLLLLLVGVATIGTEGRTLAQTRAAKKRVPPNPAFAPVKDDPALPRVLLIGDSISIGYTLPVRAALAGKANVHRIPTNGGPTSNGLANIDKWLGDGRWDVIHFNWGLHDLKLLKGKHQIPLDQYEQNLRKLVQRLKKTDAKLIWCTTTPVPPSAAICKPEDVVPYNDVAKKIMEQEGVVINDLYAFALPQLEKIQKPADVHYTEEGYKVLAEQVAAAILTALEKPAAAR